MAPPNWINIESKYDVSDSGIPFENLRGQWNRPSPDGIDDDAVMIPGSPTFSRRGRYRVLQCLGNLAGVNDGKIEPDMVHLIEEATYDPNKGVATIYGYTRLILKA